MPRPTQYGATTNLSVGQFIVRLLSEQHSKKRTDSELIAALKAEFPNRPSDWKAKLSVWITHYNLGIIACQNSRRPKQPASRYTSSRKPFRRIKGPAARDER